MKSIACLAPLALIVFLAACGNKGPLTLPQKSVPVEEEVLPAAPADSVPEAEVEAEVEAESQSEALDEPLQTVEDDG